MGYPRRKSNKVRRRECENCGSKQLLQGRLKEAFSPGAANGQLLVKRLPAKPDLGHRCIRIVIQPLIVPYSGCDLQGVEARYVPLGTEDWNECFRINAPRFASGLHRGNNADTHLLPKPGLVIRIDIGLLPDKRPAQG